MVDLLLLLKQREEEEKEATICRQALFMVAEGNE
jgi:hypothetical protein